MLHIRRIFRSFDPGLIRLEHAIKAALGLSTTLLVLYVVLFVLLSPPALQPILFGMTSTFILFTAVLDIQPNDRKRTLAFAALLLIGAPVLFSIVRESLLAGAVVLLVLIFLSFYLRRFGQQVAELASVFVFAFYFSFMFDASPQKLPWFALAAIVAASSAFLWTFIVKPYDPQRYLRRAVGDFGANVADVIALTAARVDSEHALEDQRDLQAGLKRVHTSRRVIEQQLSGVRDLPGWTRGRLQRLRVHLFDVEQGLDSMTHSAIWLTGQRDRIPADVRPALARALEVLRGVVAGAAAPEKMAELQAANADLVARARAASGELGTAEAALVQMGMGGARISSSVLGVRELAGSTEADASSAEPAGAPAAPPRPAGAARGRQLHPTTKLGLQAALACGLAMLAAIALDQDRPQWVFWTAYVVVAGASGESLRKIVSSVAGITLGAIVGTAVAVLLPNQIAIVLPLLLLFAMLSIYMQVINHAWMVFWMTALLALAFEIQGVPTTTILVQRPVNTVIGATIAALVVLFVFPQRAGDRLRAALSAYLLGIDAYVGALVGALIERSEPAAVSAAALRAGDAFEAVQRELPGVAMEYNPLARTGNPLMSAATAASSLNEQVGTFASFVADERDAPSAARAIGVGRDVIHENVEALAAALRGGRLPPMRTTAVALRDSGVSFPSVADDDAADGGKRTGVRAVGQLSRINQSLVELGRSLAGDAKLPAGRSRAAR